jgi:hypothetical protein
MMNASAAKDSTVLRGWLDSVSEHLGQRRSERQTDIRPKRNRARERARREARELFREYETEQTLGALLQ